MPRFGTSHPCHKCDNGLVAFARAKTKLMSEAALYEYAVGALGRRMRSVAEMRRLLRNRVEMDTELGPALVDLGGGAAQGRGGIYNDAKYAAAFSSYRRDNEKFGAAASKPTSKSAACTAT